MATKVGDMYRCEACGNKVKVLEAGNGELVCCGQPMQKMKVEFREAPATPYGP